MDNLQPEPNFYHNNEYGKYEKRFLHLATVSMLKIQCITLMYFNEINLFYVSL